VAAHAEVFGVAGFTTAAVQVRCHAVPAQAPVVGVAPGLFNAVALSATLVSVAEAAALGAALAHET